MRIIIAAVCLIAAAVPASAISRYNTATLDCSEVKSRIHSEGAVILRFRSTFNPSIPRFGRYVAHSGFCDPRRNCGLRVGADSRHQVVLSQGMQELRQRFRRVVAAAVNSAMRRQS